MDKRKASKLLARVRDRIRLSITAFAIGDRVSLNWEDAGDGVLLPRFRKMN